MRNYHILDIENNHSYFDEEQNRAIIKKVSEKCYLPANQIIYELIQQTQGRFRVAYSISGVALEQLERFYPAVIESFQRLAQTGAVEFLAESYYHSLAIIFSPGEFREQVYKHLETLNRLFGIKPTTFRNTELAYHDYLAQQIEQMGFKAVLAEGVDWLVGENGSGKLYKASGTNNVKVLLRHYRLSDDIAFRFSSSKWQEYPLYADKWASWVRATPGPLVNIFIDYETFGEHHWESSGIFSFLKYLPQVLLSSPEIEILTPAEIANKYEPMGEFAPPHWISWADTERDLSAWLGNDMQRDAMERLYQLESRIKASQDAGLIEDWRKLTTSDHFYYMSTKHAGDAEVHNYFNPHQGAHFAYTTFMRILNDIEARLNLS